MQSSQGEATRVGRKPIQWVSLKEEEHLDTEMGTLCNEEAEIRVMQLQAKECKELISTIRTWEEGREDFPLEIS